MKLLICIFIFCLTGSSVEWLLDFNKARQEAAKTQKLILLNFSGSDWCGPCIRPKKDILNSDAFNQYAADHLVLVNADFPRMKKNLLNAELTKQNEALAEKYNK